MLTYGERFMGATKATFQIWANHLHNKVVERDNIEHDMWIVPAPFCAMPNINGCGHLPGNEDQEMNRVKNMLKNNVEFYH